MSPSPAGVCPNCDLEGEIGQPCSSRGCKRRAYHFVPASYARLADGQAPDPMVGRCVGDYLTVSVLGAGGFGKVYQSLQLPILMKAALKLMHKDRGDDELHARMLEKFLGEAQALATLAHPNIVRLLKYGTHEGAPYLVMEMVEGGRTLKKVLADQAAAGAVLPHAESHHILRQVLAGLEAAHQRSIVHRDIKPENIMLQDVAGNPHFVRLLDFGLAKFVADRTATSMAIGTPVYMAPEQMLRRNIGPWTDVYAVGVILCELLTGRRPFAGEDPSQIVAKKLDRGYDPVAATGATVPGPFAPVLARALSVDVDGRYRAMGELGAALDAAFAAVAEASRRPTPAPSPAPSPAIDTARELARIEAARRELEAERARLAIAQAELDDQRRRASEASRPAAEPVGPAPIAEAAANRTVAEVAATPAEERDDSGLVLTRPVDPEVVARAVEPRGRSAPAPLETARAGPPEAEAPAIGRGRRRPLIVAGAVAVAAAVVAVMLSQQAPPERPTAETAATMTAETTASPARSAEAPPAATDPPATAAADGPLKPATAPATRDAPPGHPAMDERDPAAPATREAPPGHPAMNGHDPAAAAPPGMVAVPGGVYAFGCTEGAKDCWEDEPAFEAPVKGFGLMIREVTVAQFAFCVEVGACEAPTRGKGCTWPAASEAEGARPVTCVDWAMADAYCRHRGWRLPSEREWEAAARGPGRVDHPWGAGAPSCERAVLAGPRSGGCDTGGPWAVGTQPADRSWVGALDLGGNVREWTATEYAAYPGGDAVAERGKVNRGGSYLMAPNATRTAHTRGVDAATTARPDLGFRCAVDL